MYCCFSYFVQPRIVSKDVILISLFLYLNLYIIVSLFSPSCRNCIVEIDTYVRHVEEKIETLLFSVMFSVYI